MWGFANPPPAFARKDDGARAPAFPREPYAPDQVDEERIRAVVELVTQDIRRERDLAVDGCPVERAGHADLLILLDDPLDVVVRQLQTPSLVEEIADPQVVLRHGQAVAEEIGPRLAVAGLHADEREVVAERRLADVQVALRVAVAVVAPGHEEFAAGRLRRRRAARWRTPPDGRCRPGDFRTERQASSARLGWVRIQSKAALCMRCRPHRLTFYFGVGAQVERRHLLRVADEQDAVGKRRHVPGFALDRRHAGQLLKLLRA